MGVLSFDEISDRASIMMDELADRDSRNEELEDMARLEWTDAPTKDIIKESMDPTPHNVINTVDRLLSTSEPSINIKPIGDGKDEKILANNVEKLLIELLRRSDRQRQYTFISDSIKSAATFGECITKVIDLRMLNRSRGKKKALTSFPDHLTPIVIQSLSPRSTYYQFADFGLARVLESRQRRVSDIKMSWGKLADNVKGADDEEVTFNEYWDYDPFDGGGTRCVWVNDDEILLEPVNHECDFLPYSVRFANGVSWMEDEADKRMSLLFPIHKTSIWKRMNLLLTLMSTNVFLYTNPHWVAKLNDDREIGVNLDELGGVTKLRPGESLDPLARQLIPQEMNNLLTIMRQFGEESTIPRVVTGAAPGGVSAGYAINILSQSGKLVIYPIERAVNQLLSDSLSIALSWGKRTKVGLDMGNDLKISDDECSKFRYSIDCRLRASMPTDKIALANTWANLIGQGLGDPETMWEEMGYPNSTEMTQKMLDWQALKKNIDNLLNERALAMGYNQKQPDGTNTMTMHPAEKGQIPVPPVPEQVMPPDGMTNEQIREMKGMDLALAPEEPIVPPPVV